MTKRKLKLPSGGTLDLPIPDGFGAPVFALNDGLGRSPHNKTLVVYLVAVGIALFNVWLMRKILKD